MSLNHTAGIDKIPANDEAKLESNADSASAVIRVTDHAKLRYRQRVDPMASHPADDLRQRWQRGEPVQSPQVPEGRARATGEYLVVYKESESHPVIVTILRRCSLQ